MPMIVVADVLKALEKVGAAARKRSKAKIIAVTGSAGKTTTKEMLRSRSAQPARCMPPTSRSTITGACR